MFYRRALFYLIAWASFHIIALILLSLLFRMSINKLGKTSKSVITNSEHTIKDTLPNLMATRDDFPILHSTVHGKPLVYFDNGATSQKPHTVIDRITKYYETENGNVHRAVHHLSELAGHAYEGARDTIKTYLNASKREEIIFVRGATEGINLVASSWGRKNLRPDDEVIISGMEHHSNIVPWQLICEERGAKLRIIPVDENGELVLDEYKKLLNENTRFVSVVYVSNGIGTINPVKEIISEAHKYNVPVLIDGCQAAPHIAIDLQDMDCDFFVFSGHKVFGPTGIGVLYGKEAYLNEMPPYQSGGDMIKTVSFEKTTFNDLPYKFEAGTPDISGAIGLATALNYVSGIGHANIAHHEKNLLVYLTDKLKAIPGMRILGEAKNKICLVSFVIEGAHPLDIGTMLDFEGVAIRTGNHCTQPLMESFGVSASCRVSLAFYNTIEEIDVFIEALNKVLRLLK